MARIRITRPSRDDGNRLRELEKTCFPPADIFTPSQFRRLLRSPTCRILVVKSADGRIQAEIIGLLRHFSIPSGRIYKIAVHSSLAGKGLGSTLIRRMEGEFRTVGMRKVCAEVRVTNTISQRLFERNGYGATGPLPRYYPDGEDGIKFWKELRPRGR